MNKRAELFTALDGCMDEVAPDSVAAIVKDDQMPDGLKVAALYASVRVVSQNSGSFQSDPDKVGPALLLLATVCLAWIEAILTSAESG